MSNPNTPGCDSAVNEFAKHGGITNGAAWYSVPGGMQVTGHGHESFKRIYTKYSLLKAIYLLFIYIFKNIIKT